MPSTNRGSFAVLCASTFFQFLAMGILLVALPLFVTDELGRSRAVVGLAVGASFSVTAVLLRPVAGRMLDAKGRRPFLLGGPALVLASSAGLLVAHSLWAVVALRLLHGAAGAFYYTAAATVATDLAPADQRAARIARYSLFLYAGLALGPAAGEQLIRLFDFSGAWLAIGVCAALALALAALVPETRPAGTDEARAAARAAAVEQPPTWWARVVHPASVGPGLVLMTVAVGYTAIATFSSLYARRLGMSAGLLYVCFAGAVFGIRLVSGTLADRYGRIAVALPGMVAGALGLGLLAGIAHPAAAVAGVALFGGGFAMVFPALMALTVDRVPDAERGAALGSYTAFFDVGSAIGGYAVGALADSFGYRWAWAVPALLCVFGAAGLLRTAQGGQRFAGGSATSSLPEPAGA